MVFCRVESWLTGKRLVSLPFSDHCDVLVNSVTDLQAIIAAVRHEMRDHKLKYAEIRGATLPDTPLLGCHSTHGCCLHQIDLSPTLDTLFQNCHADSTRSKIRRAQREGLGYEEGRSKPVLRAFYDLLLLTRRRHGLPPQPKQWFNNLIDCFGEALTIRIALKNRQPIAAILTLQHKNTLVYKFGCSDAYFHSLGGMHLLLWNSIKEAKQKALHTFDLGRSELTHTGLIRFKNRWHAQCSPLTYVRLLAFPQLSASFGANPSPWTERASKAVLPHLPDFFVESVGRFAYKHIG